MATVRHSLNIGNPNSIAVDLQMLGAGEAFNLIPKTVRGKVVDNVLVLPEDARAYRVDSAYAMGTSNGFKTPAAVGSGATPSAGQVGITGDGNIVFAAADGITDALVVYLAPEGELFEDVVDVASNLATLSGGRRARLLLAAERLSGGTAGLTTVVSRPATPTAGQAALGAADDATVAFAGADGVTRARIRYLAIPGVGSTNRKTVAEALRQVHGGV
jgi:hypothetical protein